jgi:hypothetical protein
MAQTFTGRANRNELVIAHHVAAPGSEIICRQTVSHMTDWEGIVS